MKITCLVDNESLNDNFKSEHGLSLYIETENRKILFDMGQTTLFNENALHLGIDLSQVDLAVVSHGHYDHGGGLEHFLKLNNKATVYIHNLAFGEYYNGTEKYIGLKPSLLPEKRFVFTNGVTKIDKGLTLFDLNRDSADFFIQPQGLNEKINGEYIPDKFLHEQYLLIEENSKSVLISGCSHKGIENITNFFMPDVLIGGFHFSKMPLDENLKMRARQLSEYNTKFYTCHCTGKTVFDFMKNIAKNVEYLSCGSSIVI
ncbi:MAG: MBL fold metallo-hydrolase [Ruminococcaceae bacterium]|nr:MBL fold metallo-hydrolase [Oscillospiraceae bacterium]